MKIGTILILSFLAVGVIGVLFGTYFLYKNSEELIEGHVIRKLESTAQSRTNHVETYLQELMKSVAVAATHSELSEEELMEISGINQHLHSLYVLDSEGKTITSSGETPCGRDLSDKEVYIKGKMETVLINRYFCQTFDEEMMAIATPHAGGVLVARIDKKGLWEIVKDRTGLGDTGEVLVAIQGEGEKIYLFERLFEEEALQTVESEATAEPMKQALLGNEKRFEDALDYRDEHVLAVSQFVEVGEIGLVAKIDVAEALGTARSDLFRTSVIVGIIIVIFVSFVGWFISRKMSKPLVGLTDNVNQITKGKLDIQLEGSNINEIKGLTDSLNRVLASLKLAILRTGVGKGQLGLGKAVEEKHEAEERYKVLYETSSDAIMIIEPPTWKFTDANPATVKMFGAKDKDHFTSLSPSDVSPKKQPDGSLSSEKAKKMILKAVKEGENFFEWTHQTVDGKEFPATVKLTKFRLKGKDVLQATVRKVNGGAQTKVKSVKKKSLKEK